MIATRQGTNKNRVKPCLSCFISLNALHQFVFFPYCSLYTSNVTKKDYLFKNQEPLQLVIIVFILVTFMCDSGVILYGEIRCCTLLELKGLTKA